MITFSISPGIENRFKDLQIRVIHVIRVKEEAFDLSRAAERHFEFPPGILNNDYQ
jgi:hypothetical protein